MKLFPAILALLFAVAVYFLLIERTLFSDPVQDQEPAAQPQETSAAPPSTQPATAKPLISAVVHTSQVQEIDDAVILRGQTEPQRQVQMRAETSGTVLSEPLRKGRFVEAGTLLCALEPGTRHASLAEARARAAEAEARAAQAATAVPESQARLAEARARLIEAQTNSKAASSLFESGFASDTRLKSAEAALASAQAAVSAATSGLSRARTGIQSAQAGIESARASVAAAEREINSLDIKAPFAGILETDTAELGSLLQRGDLCATVIQLDPIKLVGFVPETDVNKITIGATATAQLTVGGAPVSGKVEFISRTADQATRTFRVEISTPNVDLKIRGGQTAQIAISAPGAQAHLLPASALTLNESGVLGLRTVAGIKDDIGTVRFAPVTLLRDTIDGVWVTGLPARSDVIVVGQEYVTPGVQVRVARQNKTT